MLPRWLNELLWYLIAFWLPLKQALHALHQRSVEALETRRIWFFYWFSFVGFYYILPYVKWLVCLPFELTRPYFEWLICWLCLVGCHLILPYFFIVSHYLDMLPHVLTAVLWYLAVMVLPLFPTLHAFQQQPAKTLRQRRIWLAYWICFALTNGKHIKWSLGAMYFVVSWSIALYHEVQLCLLALLVLPRTMMLKNAYIYCKRNAPIALKSLVRTLCLQNEPLAITIMQILANESELKSPEASPATPLGNSQLKCMQYIPHSQPGSASDKIPSVDLPLSTTPDAAKPSFSPSPVLKSSAPAQTPVKLKRRRSRSTHAMPLSAQDVAQVASQISAHDRSRSSNSKPSSALREKAPKSVNTVDVPRLKLPNVDDEAADTKATAMETAEPSVCIPKAAESPEPPLGPAEPQCSLSCEPAAKFKDVEEVGSEPAVFDDKPDAKWPSDAWVMWSRNYVAGAGADGRDIGDLFEVFRTSCSVEAIATSFARLLDAALLNSSSAVTGDAFMPLDVISTAVGDSRRLPRVLWEVLDMKRAEADYCDHPLAGHHVVIVGSGPVGLRCAIDLRLLGAEVVVLEKRESFDRINRLHLWPWCGDDLKRLGAKVLEPPELSFGANADFLHIGIAELQMLLLKTCLLYGVQVFFGAEYLGPKPQTSEAHGPHGWDVMVANPAIEGTCKVPGPLVPCCLHDVSVLVGADGPRGRVAREHGLEVHEVATLRKGASLGLIANYKNQQTPAEKSRRPFSLARQFYEQLFKDCEQQTGIELENVVCYISAQTHYFVMTPTRKSLQRFGVFPGHASPHDLNFMDTLDEDAVARAARAVAAFCWKPGEKPLPEESLESPVGPAKLFDFSRQRRAAAGMRVVEGPSVNGEEPAKMLVGLCGDALIEPFWPEGLGVVRGFFGALDIASSARVWGESGDPQLAVAHFEAAFRQLKSLAAKTRDQVLRPDEDSYGLDPASRYRAFSTARSTSVEMLFGNLSAKTRSSSMP